MTRLSEDAFAHPVTAISTQAHNSFDPVMPNRDFIRSLTVRLRPTDCQKITRDIIRRLHFSLFVHFGVMTEQN